MLPLFVDSNRCFVACKLESRKVPGEAAASPIQSRRGGHHWQLCRRKTEGNWQVDLAHYQADTDKYAQLSARERELLLYWVEGKTAKEIAAFSARKEATIKTQLKQLRKKLGLKSRAELWHFADRLGLLDS